MRNPADQSENMRELLDMVGKGELRPHISHRYSLAEAAQALRDMDARKVKGKVVVVPGQ